MRTAQASGWAKKSKLPRSSRIHNGHEVIGYACDLQTITRDDLYAHYRKYYAPNNAVLAIAGDFDARDMLERIARQYGQIKPSPKIPSLTTVEPPHQGERRVVVKGEGDTDYLVLAFRAPSATHEDYMPLVALDSVLCGASGLSLFGSGTSNRSSRLSKALVDAGDVADISSGLVPTIDSFLYTLQAMIMPGKHIAEVEQKLWAELEKVKQKTVTRAEPEKAVKQTTRAQVAFGTETATNQAFWLGFSEVIADYTWFTTLSEAADARVASGRWPSRRSLPNARQRYSGLLPGAGQGRFRREIPE